MGRVIVTTTAMARTMITIVMFVVNPADTGSATGIDGRHGALLDCRLWDGPC